MNAAADDAAGGTPVMHVRERREVIVAVHNAACRSYHCHGTLSAGEYVEEGLSCP